MKHKEAIELIELLEYGKATCEKIWQLASLDGKYPEKAQETEIRIKKFNQALALLKEQPPASEFTTLTRKHCSGKTYGISQSEVDWLFEQLSEACDRLDASEASRKELVVACEVGFSYIQAIAHRIPRPLDDLSDDRELVKAAIEKAEK